MAYMKDLTGRRLDSIAIPSEPEMQGVLPSRHMLAQTRHASTTSSPGTLVAIPGAVAVVPPDSNPWEVKWTGLIGISAAGGGYASLLLYELTGGVVTLREQTLTRISSTDPLSIGAGGIARQRGTYDVEAGADYRLFGLYISTARDGGSTLTTYLRNDDTDYGRATLVAKRA